MILFALSRARVEDTLRTLFFGRRQARTVTIVIMMIGSLFLSMPLSIIGAEFEKAWMRLDCVPFEKKYWPT